MSTFKNDFYSGLDLGSLREFIDESCQALSRLTEVDLDYHLYWTTESELVEIRKCVQCRKILSFVDPNCESTEVLEILTDIAETRGEVGCLFVDYLISR